MAQLPEGFHSLPLLTPEECQQVRDTLHLLQPYWRKRSQYPFFTMGAASYLDHAFGSEAMLAKAAQDNAILLEHFQWLYDRLLKVLHGLLNESVLLDPEFALPGFHIFQGHEAFTQPVASVHFDLQYDHYDWSRYREVDRMRPISMTLPVCLPASGAGLRVWDMTWERAQTMSRKDLDHFKKTAPFTYHPYEPGQMVVHSGHHLHQIAPIATIQPGDERITLQAHSDRTEQGWVVYW